MIEELEWGGVQQLALLLQSGGLGVALGLLLSWLSGLGYGKTKIWRFVSDMVFCVFAAVFTFYAGLVLTDGRLHPVLFLGLLSGMCVEHILVGKWVSRFAYKTTRLLRGIAAFLFALLMRFFEKIKTLLRKFGVVKQKIAKNVKKTRKNRHFFQKKT